MPYPGQEIILRRKIRNSKIQRAILQSLYVTGVVSLAVLAPNTLVLLKKFDQYNRKQRKIDPKYSVNNAINRLRRRGLITWEKGGKSVFLRLTTDGEKTIRALERRDFKIAKPRKWDGKWRIIIFDIREAKRNTRDQLRNTLVSIGFLKLQQSVWVYPYDCEELITLLKADLKIGKDILYIIADSIENDRWVKNHFNLSSG